MDKAVLGIPGSVTIAGREFVIPQPTSADVVRVHNRMRELAQRSCVSPLAYVNANAEGLNPVVLSESLRAAIAMGSGGGVEPNRETVFRAYDTLEGVRFRLWYFARKTQPALTQDDVAGLVVEDNVYDVSDALAKAQPAPETAGPLAPRSGAS